MSTVAERLRRLRSDAGAAAPASAPAPTGAPRADALRALLRVRERRRAALPAPAGVEVATGVRLIEWRCAWPADPHVALPLPDAPLVERERLLCFDTETTGLAGGVGTRAFMIGVAGWSAQQLHVRQIYLTTIAGEAAMLALFAGWLGADTILASYNGKCYDAPLLKGRLRLNRIAHRLDTLPHVDWLHPTRRRYRGVYENCRLATIERHALGIVREDDLPGSEAPAAWLAFLRGHSSRNLARVIEHNRQDVVTLMRLGDHLGMRGAVRRSDGFETCA
jgi:uncharacterized protein YprB with RNaseH-like and TPR domain